MSSKQRNYSAGHEFELQIERLLNKNGIQARIVPLQDELSFEEKATSTKQTLSKTEIDFKRYIEKLLNENKILANSFYRRDEDNRREGDKIDLIATFNRQIILIHVSSIFNKNILKDFQTSVYQFGEGILSVIVYNSNNPLSKNEGLCSKVKVVTEKMLVSCIKNNLSLTNTSQHDELFETSVPYENGYNIDQEVSSSTESRRNDFSSNNEQIGNSHINNNDASWSCPECTCENRPLALQCEGCMNVRPTQNTSQWDCPRCTLINEGD
ncbi:10665_t:CDS:2, partial [Cetraspora pellucida]